MEFGRKENSIFHLDSPVKIGHVEMCIKIFGVNNCNRKSNVADALARYQQMLALSKKASSLCTSICIRLLKSKIHELHEMNERDGTRKSERGRYEKRKTSSRRGRTYTSRDRIVNSPKTFFPLSLGFTTDIFHNWAYVHIEVFLYPKRKTIPCLF